MPRGGKMNDEMWTLAKRMNHLMDEWMHAKFRGEASGAWEPPVDIVECEEFLCILVELAGMELERIDVRFEGQTVTISGTRTLREVSGPIEVHQMELARGPFRRTVQTPFDVPVDDVTVAYDVGLLEIRMPKPHVAK